MVRCVSCGLVEKNERTPRAARGPRGAREAGPATQDYGLRMWAPRGLAGLSRAATRTVHGHLLVQLGRMSRFLLPRALLPAAAHVPLGSEVDNEVGGVEAVSRRAAGVGVVR